MKRIYTTEPYRKFNKKRADRHARRNLAFKKHRRAINRSQQGARRQASKAIGEANKQFSDYKKVFAPDDFRFIDNTEEVIRFINKLWALFLKRKKVFVILKNVSQIDYGAIIVLLSVMIGYKSSGISFNGDYPKDGHCDDLIRKSGFFEHLYKNIKLKDRYQIATSNNQEHEIHTHAWKNVDSKLGEDIIKAASKIVWGEERRCQGVQRALIELMLNTNNHAKIGQTGVRHWWLSVNQEAENKKVCFSFLDFGVGVFKSLDNKPSSSKFYNWFSKLTKAFTFENNAELLKLIMKGDLHKTVTGKHYRGKGLPGIANVLKRNQLSNLHIITNNAIGNIAEDHYALLNNSFSGTFVYWEVNSGNNSCGKS